MPDWIPPELTGFLIQFFALPEEANFWTLINSPFLVAIIASVIGFQLNGRLNSAQAETNIAMRLAQAEQAYADETDATSSSSQMQGKSPQAPAAPVAESLSDEVALSAEPPAAPTDAEDDIEDTLDIPDFLTRPPRDEGAGPPKARFPMPEGMPGPPNAPRPDFSDEASEIAERARRLLQERRKADKDGRHQRTYEKMDLRNPIALAIALNERKQLSGPEYKAVERILLKWNRYSKGRATHKRVPESVVETMREDALALGL